MTLTFGIVALIGIGIAWKAKGQQLWAIIYGGVAVKCLEPGSTVDTIYTSGGEVFRDVVASLTGAFSESNLAVVTSAMGALPW